MTRLFFATLAVAVLMMGRPDRVEANPFRKLIQSVKVQKGSPAPAAAPSAAPAQAAAAPPPVAAAVPVVGSHPPRCQPSVAASNTLTPADKAAVARIVPDGNPSVAKTEINGDDKTDYVIVDSANCGTGGCVTDVYVSAGNAHVQVFSSELMSEVDIGTTATNGFCDIVSDGVRYGWNGRTYASLGPAPATKRVAAAPAATKSQPLESYGGKKAFSEILSAEPALDKDFKKLLGERYADFFNNFTISDNALVEGGYLVGHGCRQGSCDSEFAVGAVSLKDHALYGVILSSETGPSSRSLPRARVACPSPSRPAWTSSSRSTSSRPHPTESVRAGWAQGANAARNSSSVSNR